VNAADNVPDPGLAAGLVPAGIGPSGPAGNGQAGEPGPAGNGQAGEPSPAGNGQAGEPSPAGDSALVVEGVSTGDADLADVAGPNGQAGEDGDREPDGSWLHGEELRGMRQRWREIQVSFVDDPRQAVTGANTMVADLMRRLAQALFDERAALETRCLGREDTSTEDLRQGLRRYRAVFERLLASTW
jgi:hypothetical protein